MASSLFRGAVFAGPVISLAWMPVRLHLHLSMSRWQDSANGNDPARPQGRYFHPMWLGGVRMPERATGGDAVADELFDLLDFRKAAPLLPRPVSSSSMRTSKTPPVLSGVSVTEPSSSANVVNSSCAIQPARRPQPHNLQ